VSRWKQLAAGLVLSCLAIGAAGGLDARAEGNRRVPVERATTEQKAIFVGNLVSRSVAARTIETKGDEAAKEKLAEAKSMVEDAKSEIASGNYANADSLLDDALRLVNTEARKLSESDTKHDRLVELYDRRHHAVSTFLSAYERVSGTRELSGSTQTQVQRIKALVTEAESFAAAGKLTEAIDALDEGYKMARGNIREIRDGETLTRSLNFATPADEYRYERDRNDSHIMLLRFAIAEKKPPPVRTKRIDQLHDQALELRQEADKMAESGKHDMAIERINLSTDTLLKAIRMSGIWIPG